MFRITLSVLALCLFGMQANADPINSKLSSVSISDKGELLSNGTYKAWSSNRSVGKPHLIFYLAGRMSAKNKITPLTKALPTKTGTYHATTIVNGSDVTMGASSIALSELKKNKKKHPGATFVFDASGKARTAWGLKKANAATFVLDKNKKVVFFKEGALSGSDVTKVKALLK